MNSKQLLHVKDLFSKFIWGDSRAKIPLKILQMDKKSGGLKLVDLQKRDWAIKASWIKILINDKKMSELVYSFFAPPNKTSYLEM